MVICKRTVMTFHLYGFNASILRIHVFSFYYTNSRFLLYELTISTISTTRIHDFFYANSRFLLCEPTISNIRTHNCYFKNARFDIQEVMSSASSSSFYLTCKELKKKTSGNIQYIHKIQVMKSWSLNHKIYKIVESRNWNREFVK